MKNRLLLGLLIAAAVAVGIVFLGGDRDDDSGGTTRREGGADPAPRGQVPVTWPESFDGEDRALLQPRFDDLVGTDEEIMAALADLGDDATRARFGDRSRDLLGILHPFLDDLLREAADPVRRAVVALLDAWMAEANEETRALLAEAVPLTGLDSAFGSTRDELLLRETLLLVTRIPGPAALRLLIRAAPHENPVIRREAMRALAARDDPTARAAMRERLAKDPDGGVQAEILSLWRHRAAYRPEDLPELVRPLLSADELVVRVAAIDLVGVLLDRRSLPALGAALARGDRDTTLAVVNALGRLGGKDAGRILANVEDPGAADAELSRQLIWAKGRCK